MNYRLALLTIFCAGLASAEPWTCPAAITTARQQLATPIAGWEPMLDSAPLSLSGITFFDGPPEEQASLVYDKIVKAGGKEIASWTFSAQSKTWLTCHYAGTSTILKKALPKVTSCTVSYNPNEHIAGLPAIEKISCK